MKKRSTLGLLRTDTYSVCTLKFRDQNRADYLSFNAMIRRDSTDRWVHIALPVLHKTPQRGFLAGIPVIHPTFEFADAFFRGIADSYPGVESFCKQEMALMDLFEFLVADLLEAGIPLDLIEDSWSQLQTVIEMVLGPL